MTTYVSAKAADDTAARIARIRARRAGVTFPAMEVTVADIQPGDFVDVIHGHANLRGMRFDTAITQVRSDYSTYRMGRMPVAATWLSTRHGGSVAFPSSFRASIRRPSA